MLVGGDRQCKKVPEVLYDKHGIRKIIKWTGRKNLKGEPCNLALVVFITGFVSHAVYKKAMNIAKKNGAKVIYVNKTLARLAEAV